MPGRFADRSAPQLLVSVRNVSEARAALDGGADIIDLKEPHAGSLGPVSSDVAQKVAAMMLRVRSTTEGMDGRDCVPLSLAMGELQQCESPLPNEATAEETAAFRIFSFAKTGLAGCGADLEWQRQWNSWRAKLPGEMDAVAVIYADWRAASAPPPDEILAFAATHSVRGVLIDTWEKKTKNLFDALSPSIVERLTQQAHEAGMWMALAGSLNSQTVTQAVLMHPDIIAVRGAACGGNRADRVRQSAVAALRQRIKLFHRSMT